MARNTTPLNEPAKGNPVQGADVKTGNTAPPALAQGQGISNSTATSPLEDRTAAANTRPREDGDAAAVSEGDAGATGDLNNGKFPNPEAQTGVVGSKTLTPEDYRAERGTGATKAGMAPSVEADMTETWVHIERASANPVMLYVHGVGRWSLNVDKDYALPKDAVAALRDAGVTFRELDETAAAAAKAKSGTR